ncbi:Coiled-coil alpha-helical rod protein 1, partial [Geodia barretti]
SPVCGGGESGDTCSEQEEDIAALRRENESLRSQLQAVGFSASSNAAMHHPCISQCPPAVLTSDLLQVERSLQSRVVQLESEGRRLAEQLAESQTSLREERASHTRDRDNLIVQHRAEVEQVTSDRGEAEERWRRECEEWRVRVGRAEEGERERMDELKLAEQKLACVTQEKTEVCGQLEQERSGHTEEVASLQLQLTAATDQNEKIQGELEAARQCVHRLESYLGGELPEEGLTWRDERTALLTRILEMEGERERGERETHLMAVRLAAISEILSLQETALQGKGVGAVEKARAEEIGSSPKEPGDGDVATQGGGEGGLKSLLTLWREKVFALLVQARLTQMQHGQELINTQARVSALAGEVGERQRERDLVTHTLTDRTAQLQLLTTQNEELGRCVQRAEEGWMASQTAADGLSEGLHLALTGVGQRWARLKSCLDGCLSRLASYQQRVGVATGRVAALKVLVGSQMVLGGGKITRDNPPRGDYVIAERYDVTTQTEPSEKAQDLSK